MSQQVSDTETTTPERTATRLDILGDECARIILVETSDGPRTAKELTARTESSSATVYRRINTLLESDLLAECIRFDEDGSHTTAYEATAEHVSVDIDPEGISVKVVEADDGRDG